MIEPGRKAEVVAYCQPNDPCSASAFSWPGSERNPKHTMELIPAQALIDMQARLDRVAELAAEWEGEASEKCAADDQLDRVLEFSMNHTLRYCANELRTLLSRDATTTEEPGEGG